MEQQRFDDYLQNRYRDQIDWYDKKSMSNQNTYKNIQKVLIILSASTPVLIAITFYYFTKWYVALFPIVISVIVAILTSVVKTFKYQENWMNYRTICETLKKEYYLYQAEIGDYGDTVDKEALFVERVESLISRENSLWIETCKEERKDLA